MLVGLSHVEPMFTAMKKIYVMDETGMVEYIPATTASIRNMEVISETVENPSTEDVLLSIADLTKKFKVSRPTIYAWEKKGLLKRVQLEGRVLFDPHDIKLLIQSKKAN